MKIRNLEALEDSLDKDLVWRKKEFTNLKFMIEKSRNHESLILIRSAIMLMYSHWEGHVKHCSLAYLNYLNHQGLSCNKVTDNFLLVTLGEEFRSGFSIAKIKWQKKLLMYLQNSDNNKFKVKEDLIIDTESNLKYEVLINIIEQLGLDSSNFQSKENLLDKQILLHRNTIAHGGRIEATEAKETYETMEFQLIDMIEEFHRQIRNAASNRQYLKPN